MDTNALLQLFGCEMQCEYKHCQYLVRDNGAILRLPKDGCKPSKWDNVWTFGTKDEKTGYMLFTGNVRVHQVVCTAFHGSAPQPHMVVDHVDTNRCNNRPENLRWLTRIENALNNDATRKKIIYLCGSVEAFIENPAILRTKALPPNVSWMKTVTKEEAAACKKHIDEWVARDSKHQETGKGLGDWVFSNEDIAEVAKWNGVSSFPEYKPYAFHDVEVEVMTRHYLNEQYGLKDSLTPGAKQLNWKTPTEFLLCPLSGQERTLQSYLYNLTKGKVFSRNVYSNGGTVLECGYNPLDDALYVLTFKSGEDEVKPWALCKVTLQDGAFVHENLHSFFHEDGGLKNFTLAMGREWYGGDVFDDYC